VTAAPHGGDTDYRSRPTRPDYETYLRRIGRRSVRRSGIPNPEPPELDGQMNLFGEGAA
jgi:hypothetical protein